MKRLQAQRLATMVSEARVREIAKALKCTPRQCRQHLLAASRSSDVSAERAIELIRGARS
jgi:hypothetical protein